jgi:hypothetical protein
VVNVAGAPWRILFVFALLLVSPSIVRAETGEAEVAVVAPLARASFDDIGLAPHTVTIARVIVTPGAGEAVQRLPGPRLILVESGTLALHATGTLRIIRASTEQPAGPTATPSPTPDPFTTPTTDVILNPGDVAPVPIWTMHALRNDGSEPAVILDVRVTAGDPPTFPADLDVEVLAEESGLTTLPAGRTTVDLGETAIAPGGMVLAPRADWYQLVAAKNGEGPVTRAADGSVPNPRAEALDAFVLVIEPAGGPRQRAPEQPAHGPGGADVAFDRVVATHYGPEDQGYWLYEPADPHPGTPMATTGPFPVILFLGGCCGPTGDGPYSNQPSDVQAWLDHLTQRGAIVIYPIVRPEQHLEDTVAAMRDAMARLGTGTHVAGDWTRFVVFGYSFGGWNAPLFAAASAAEGLPVPQAILSTVAYDPGTTPDLSAIPATTRVVVLVDADEYGWSDHGSRRIWAALTTVPPDHRTFVKVNNDLRGLPPLIANHQLPATGDYGTLNALDWYGTWKLGDALLSCTFAGQDCEYAFGDTPDVRFMGYWSNGEPVNEIEVVAEPAPPDPETPTP